MNKSRAFAAVPRDTSNLLVVGEETYNRQTRVDSSGLTNGRLQLTYFTARKSETTSQVRVISGGTATATVTLARIGLYSIAANGDGTFVAATDSDTSLLASTNTLYTRSWAVPAAKVAGQRYALGVLVLAATAGSVTSVVTSGFGTELATAPRLNGIISGLSDLPASFAEAGLSTTSFLMYGAVLP